jgi:hydrogenase maturation factor
VAFVPRQHADRALEVMGCEARNIGEVQESGRVTLETPLATVRLLDMPEGDPLPRIC